jgi:hypothetical protein
MFRNCSSDSGLRVADPESKVSRSKSNHVTFPPGAAAS